MNDVVQALVELAKHDDRRGFEVVARRAGLKSDLIEECYEGTKARIGCDKGHP